MRVVRLADRRNVDHFGGRVRLQKHTRFGRRSGRAADVADISADFAARRHSLAHLGGRGRREHAHGVQSAPIPTPHVPEGAAALAKPAPAARNDAPTRGSRRDLAGDRQRRADRRRPRRRRRARRAPRAGAARSRALLERRAQRKGRPEHGEGRYLLSGRERTADHGPARSQRRTTSSSIRSARSTAAVQYTLTERGRDRARTTGFRPASTRRPSSRASATRRRSRCSMSVFIR